jgi:hypothetical protein
LRISLASKLKTNPKPTAACRGRHAFKKAVILSNGSQLNSPILFLLLVLVVVFFILFYFIFYPKQV